MSHFERLQGKTWAARPDDLSALNTLISNAANGSTVTLERRHYWLSGSIVIPPGKANLTLDLNGATLHWSAPASGDNLYGIKVGMQAGNPLTLDAVSPTKRTTLDDNLTVKYDVSPAPAKGATTIVLTGTIGTAPAAGDIWILYDRQQLVDVSSGPTTTAIRTWTFKVASYNSGTKTITVDASSGACPYSFTGTVRCAKLNGVATYGSCENITIKNGKVDGRAWSNRARQRYIVHAQCVHGLTVENVHFFGVQTGAVNTFACTNVTVRDCRAEDMGLVGGGEGVGFWFHGTHRVDVQRPYGRSLRHLVEFCDGSSQGLVTDGVCEQQDPSGAAWDTHGGGDHDIEFRNCVGGWIHFGNASFCNGGTNLKATGCRAKFVKLIGAVDSATVERCDFEWGVLGLTLKNGSTNYAPLAVTLDGCTIGTWDDGGCIRFAGTGGGIPKLTNLTVRNCLVVNTEASGTYCQGVDITNWNSTSGTLLVEGCVFHAPNRTDGKDFIRLWGDDTNMSIASLTLTVRDSKFQSRSGKLINIRSTAGRVGSGTVTVQRNALYCDCTAETSAGLATSWNSACSLTASGNGIRRWT